MKICRRCKEEYTLDNFYKKKSNKDGFDTYCKICSKYYKILAYDANLNSHLSTNKLYKETHKEELKIKGIEYRSNNKHVKNEIHKLKSLTDPLYKLTHNVRSLISKSIYKMGFEKTSKTAEILGCTFEEFKAHIESLFQPNMSWENRALWHLDHIFPVSRAVDEEHLIALNHYTNFQPLWAEDNLRKGNKLPE